VVRRDFYDLFYGHWVFHTSGTFNYSMKGKKLKVRNDE
jgi:hypothetical protein